MEERGVITVVLTGGPMDGDELTLSPHGSVGPPHQLCYLTATSDEAAWMVYEVESVLEGWPEPPGERRKFHYIGTYSLGKEKLLKE